MCDSIIKLRLKFTMQWQITHPRSFCSILWAGDKLIEHPLLVINKWIADQCEYLTDGSETRALLFLLKCQCHVLAVISSNYWNVALKEDSKCMKDSDSYTISWIYNKVIDKWLADQCISLSLLELKLGLNLHSIKVLISCFLCNIELVMSSS